MTDSAGRTVESAYPISIEVGDMVFAFSIKHGRNVAIKVDDVLITTSEHGDKLYHLVSPNGITLSFSHSFKLKVLRREQ